jgi:4-amino-4-deoxy-L-arabinose transferase-like glycosyltransferase
MQLETAPGHISGGRSVWATIQRAITARRGAFALALIVLSSLAFRVQMSHECSFSLDEASTHQDAMKPWPAVLKGPSKEHPPLSYVLAKSSIVLFGESETGMRAFTLFFGCVLLVVIYQLCLELGLTVGRSLVTTATFALSPFLIKSGTDARQYAIYGSFITLALICTLRLLRGPLRIRDLIGFAAGAALAAWTHYFALAYALALLGALLIGIAPSWKRTRVAKRLVAVALLIGLLAVFWLVAVRIAALVDYYSHGKHAPAAGPLFNTDLLFDFSQDFGFMSYKVWSFAIQPLLALVGLVLLTLRLRGIARLLPLGLGLMPCIAALFLSSGHFVAARYLAPSAVLYHLAACVALFAALDLVRRVPHVLAGRARRVLVPLAGWLVLAGLVTARLCEFPNGFGTGTEYFQGLQSYFVQNLAKDTRVVAYFGDFGWILFAREYRLGSPPIYLEKFRRVRGIDRYLVIELNVFGDRRPAFESLIEQKFGLTAQEWRALPLVPLPHSRYQPSVPAHFVQLPSDNSPAPERRRHR